MWPFNKKETKIQENYDVLGQPYTWQQLRSLLAPYRTAVPYAYDPWQYKAATIRTINELDQVRATGRWLTETNPWAHGMLSGLRAFIISDGFKFKITSKTDNKNKSIIKQVEEILNDFAEDNTIEEWYQEKFYRDHRDGETFLQLWNGPDGLTLRAVEPDQIRCPVGESHEGPWSFGIRHKDWDYQTPVEYCVQRQDGSQDRFPANQIFHSKLNVVKNVKRGISSYYPVYEILQSTHKLLWCWTEGDKARTSLAYAIQSATNKTQIQALQAEQITGTTQIYGYDGNIKEFDTEQTLPGRVAHIPDGMTFVNPPTGADSENTIRTALSAVCARFNAPGWLVGDNSDSSYSAQALPESLFLRRCEHEQSRQIRHWKKLYREVLKWHINKGTLPETTLDMVQVDLEPPAPISRNRTEEIKSDLELVRAKFMSQHTFSSKYGIDWEHEQAIIASEPEQELPQQQVDKPPETTSGELQKDNAKE